MQGRRRALRGARPACMRGRRVHARVLALTPSPPTTSQMHAPRPPQHCAQGLLRELPARRQPLHRVRQHAQQRRHPGGLAQVLRAAHPHLLHPVARRGCSGGCRQARAARGPRQGLQLPQRQHGAGAGRRRQRCARGGRQAGPLGAAQQRAPHAALADGAGEAAGWAGSGGDGGGGRRRRCRCRRTTRALPRLPHRGALACHPHRHPQPLHQAHAGAAAGAQGQPQARLVPLHAGGHQRDGHQTARHPLWAVLLPRRHGGAQEVRAQGEAGGVCVQLSRSAPGV